MEHLCTLKKERSGYSLELSFDSIKSALDAALEILAFADADCYLESHSEEEPKTSPQPSVKAICRSLICFGVTEKNMDTRKRNSQSSSARISSLFVPGSLGA